MPFNYLHFGLWNSAVIIKSSPFCCSTYLPVSAQETHKDQGTDTGMQSNKHRLIQKKEVDTWG